MTPGQEALAEAMRIEQARIYGATCPEPRRRSASAADQRALDEANRRNDHRPLRLIRGAA